MWHRLPDDIIQERTKLLEKKQGLPRIVQSIIATAIFAAVLFGISFLNGLMQGDKF